MYIYILPISGGGFVVQLAILQHLSENKYEPNLILSTSGGNLSAYIGSAANWKWPKIEKIAREISKEMYISSWNNTSLISLMIGYFSGTMYDKGKGAKDFLNKYFSHQDITKYEIWTGTYNKDEQKTQLFCNRKKKDSILLTKKLIKDKNLLQTMEPIYMNGDIDLTSKVCIASASIPAIVPPQIIDEQAHNDGGIGSASPITLLHESIVYTAYKNNYPLHLFYINSVNLSNIDESSTKTKNVIDTWTDAAHNITKSLIVIDRLAARNVILNMCKDIKNFDCSCNFKNLSLIKKIQRYTNYTLVEIYPHENFEIDITNFNGDQIAELMNDIYDKCSCHVWWAKTKENKDIINSIIDEITN